MTDETQSLPLAGPVSPSVAPPPAGWTPPGAVEPTPPATGWTPPESTPPAVVELIEQRPEAAVGAAFAGGLVLALILKRLGR